MLLAVVIAAVGSMPVFLLGGLAVLVRADLGFSEARLGLIVSAFFAAAALGAVPAGLVSDRVGAASAIVIGLGLSVTALLATVVATAWWHLLMAMATGGAGHSVLQVATNVLLAGRVAPTDHGLAFGIKQSAVPAVILVAGASLPLIAVEFGWRTVYLAAIAAATVCLLTQLRRRASHVMVPIRRPTESGTIPTKRRALTVLATAAGIGAGTANALGAFFVEFAVGTGIPLGRAGVLLAISSCTSILVRLLAGRLSDRRGGVSIGLMGAMLALGALAYVLLPVVAGHQVGLALAGIVAFGAGWGWPGVLNHIVTMRNPNAPAAAAGIVHTGVYAGGVSGPFLMGLTISAANYEVAWAGAGLALVAAATLTFLVRSSI